MRYVKLPIPLPGVGDTDTVIDAVSRVTKISKANMLSESRQWPLVEARMLVYLTLYRCGLVDHHIALAMNRSRVTVCKSRNSAMNLLDVSKTFKRKYEKVQNVINQPVAQ